MAKKRMPIYGIIGIFRHFLTYNLVKYQYLTMSLSLFDYNYRIIYSTQVSAKYLYKYGFYGRKHPKISQNQLYLHLLFLLNLCY